MERLTYRAKLGPLIQRGNVSTRQVIDKFGEYEDLEERGLLLRLLCKVGDTVYTIYLDEDGSLIEEPKIKEVSTNRIWIDREYFNIDDFGKTIFLSRFIDEN